MIINKLIGHENFGFGSDGKMYNLRHNPPKLVRKVLNCRSIGWWIDGNKFVTEKTLYKYLKKEL